MSAADVLAAMDEVIADMGGDTPGTTGHRLAEARDAVAELIEANRKIVAEWGYMAKHGHCRPGVLGTGQTFDCWAVDLCETALDRVGGGA